MTQLSMVPPPSSDAPAGSFFNPVPSDGENEKDDASSLDIDEQVIELLRNRKKPAMASQPSTIKGVPTEKATGKDKHGPSSLEAREIGCNCICIWLGSSS